jgi:hypothetical protein
MELRYSGSYYERGFLVVGVTIVGPENSWVRFGAVRLALEDLEPDLIRQILMWQNRRVEAPPGDDTLV